MRAAAVLFLASPALQAADATVLWKEKVQPLFDSQCVKCHGPLEEKSGLNLDSLEGALKGGEDGVDIVPGKPDESRLLKQLLPGADPHMPPKKQLSDGEIATVREWIGALTDAPPPPTAPAATADPVPADPSAAIDHWLARSWKSQGLQPAPRCDDRTFARRAWLDLCGRIPTPAELTDFLLSADPAKRATLVDRLLASPEHARTMREVWDVLLLGRATDGRSARRRDNGWHAFLEKAFAENRPWNEVVRDMIAARPADEARKGAVWFVFEKKNDHQAIAEAVAPVIYGTQIGCAQCHDHPLAREIKQAHYWGLVAAFNRSKNVEGGPPAVGESAIGGFVNFTNLKKESQPAVMAMLTGRTIDEDRPAADAKEDDAPDKYENPDARPRVPRFSRRGALATAATQENPLLARAFVNRIWCQLFGRGIVHPADEMNSRNPASHPELLDWLAGDFAKNGCNIRRLIRGIVLSEAWQRSAVAGASAPAPESFAAALEKPLPGEALARSTLVALGRPADNDGIVKEFAAKFPDVLPRDYNATTQQAMFLTNSPLVADLFKPDPGSTLARVLAQPDPPARVSEAFAAVLGRRPDADEAKQAIDFLNGRPDRQELAVRELMWALLTGPEFLTRP